MHTKSLWTVLAAMVVLGGCGSGGDPLAPAGPAADRSEAPAAGAVEEEQQHTMNEPFSADTTGRWGGHIGSGT
jgi:hypothetical protein